MIEFIWPFAMLLLPLPFLMHFWKAVPATPVSATNNALHVPFFAKIRQMAPAVSTQSHTINRWLLWITWILAVLALTRPVLLSDEILPVPHSGRNILLAIDTSGSMAQMDLSVQNKPVSRFAITQAIVKNFIKDRTGDNLGLILFGSEAYTFTPLSPDMQTTAALFDEATVGIAGEMTSISDAIALGVKNLADTPADQRVLILLSDGYNNAGKIPLDQAVELARSENVKIYTVGVGAEQQLIQTFFGIQQLNPSADLDEKTLQAVADKTGGRYFRARSTEELAAVYETLNRLEPLPSPDQSARPKRELFYALLLPALLCLLALWVKGGRA